MTATSCPLQLSVLAERFAIARLAPDAAIPRWATDGAFFSVTRTSDELSIITEEPRLPSGLASQTGWRALKVHGPFALSEIGVVASLAAPLARAGISLFVVSTFDTDYLLVASENLAAAVSALERAGHAVCRSESE